jgi:hypothetical protein
MAKKESVSIASTRQKENLSGFIPSDPKAETNKFAPKPTAIRNQIPIELLGLSFIETKIME